MKTATQTNQSKIKRKKRKVGLFIAVIIFFALVLLILLYTQRIDLFNLNHIPKATPVYLEDSGQSLDGEVKASSREDILEALKKQQLVVTDKLSSNITFPSSKAGTIGEWIVENPSENVIIQQAEVYLNGLLIAKSTPIYPNQHITVIELLENIGTGEYDVIAYLNYYDMETKAFISKAGYRIHLTVQ